MAKVVAIIPARYGSSRFPGKPMADMKGKPMIVRVVERALCCKTITDAIVATDDNRILNAVTDAGFKAEMTSSKHESGTDRIAEVAARIDAEIVVNIQGDEPVIDPTSVDMAVQALLDDDSLNVSTLSIMASEQDYANPDVVKVVSDLQGNALYFSRSPIPFNRDGDEKTAAKKHLGLYVYRRQFLLKYAGLEQTELEKIEKLEQLRILQNGTKIRVIMAKQDSIGVDKPEDLQRAEAFL